MVFVFPLKREELKVIIPSFCHGLGSLRPSLESLQSWHLVKPSSVLWALSLGKCPFTLHLENLKFPHEKASISDRRDGFGPFFMGSLKWTGPFCGFSFSREDGRYLLNEERSDWPWWVA